MKNQHLTAAATLLLFSSSHGFSYSKRKQQQCISSSLLHYTNNADSTTTATATTTQKKPQWVPMEIIELAAEDLAIPPSQFIQTYSDIEAYTSCDDDEDALHECDFFGQYLGPTKWVHLTPLAIDSGVNRLHFEIWREVWQNPHGSVEVADVVSKETLRYYNEFILEEPRSSSSSTECTTTRPLVRVKVVPASFGLEGFEDAIWEAYEEEMNHHDDDDDDSTTTTSTKKNKCREVTFIVAAPDLSDPILMEEGTSDSVSPQEEFEPDRFRLFASSLSEKLREFEEIEKVPLRDKVQLTSFHPLWKNSEECGIVSIDGSSSEGCRYFPYPSVAVSTNVEV
mmetsp:Transcript_10629/g.15777  ORF Transcript_10629/g.15777 Transcript_10629/m.15777 type:complete len:339 (-) Transcript_10629:125-1141(-)